MENYYCYNKNMNVIERVLIYDISILCCISTLFTPSICHSATLPTSLSLVVSVDYPIRIHFDHFIHYILVSLFPFRSIHICNALITSLCRESDERHSCLPVSIANCTTNKHCYHRHHSVVFWLNSLLCIYKRAARY